MLRLVYWTLRFAIGAAILWGLTLGAILVRLYQGPFDLKAYHTWIEKGLTGVFPDLSLAFDQAYLAWGGFGHPIHIGLKEVSFQLAEQNFQAEQALAEIRLRSLIVGQILPSGLTAYKPCVRLNLDTLSLPASSKPQVSLPQKLQRLWQREENSKVFKRFALEDARIILSSSTSQPYELDHVSVMIERTKQDIKLETSGQGKDQFRWQGGLLYDRSSQKWSVDGHVQQLPLGLIFKLLGGASKGFKVDTAVRLNGNLMGAFNGKWIGQGALALTPGKLTLDFSKDPPIEVILKEAGVKIAMSDKYIVWEDLKINFQHGSFQGEGLIELLPPLSTASLGPFCSVRALINLADFSVKNLKNYWPSAVAPAARRWITQNISAGSLPKASLAVQGDFDLTKGFGLKNLGGNIHLENASVTYLDKAPMISTVSALMKYSPHTFSAKIKEGKIAEQVITAGEVIVHHLNQPQQLIGVQFTLQGAVSKVLELLQAPGLNILKPNDLPFKALKGHQKTSLKFSFPLKTNLERSEINFSAKSALKDMSILYPLSGKDLIFSKGEGALVTDSKGISFIGKAVCEEAPFDLSWQQEFSSDAKSKMTLTIKSFLTSPLLKAFGPLWLSKEFSGRAPVSLAAVQDTKGILTVDLTSSLKEASFKIGQWEKPKGRPVDLRAQAILEKEKIRKIPKFEIYGPEINIKGNASWGPAGSLENVTLLKGILGKTDVTASLVRHSSSPYSYHLNLKGRYVDVSPLWDGLLKNGYTNNNKLDLEGHLQIAEISLKNNKSFYNNLFSFTLRQGAVRTLTAHGYLEKESKTPISLTIHSKLPRVQSLKVTIPHTGTFLKHMGIIETIEGGDLQVSAMRDQNKGEQAPWKGALIMNQFKLKKAPFLGRLLGLAFPTGFADFLKGNKLSFDRLKLSFQANNDVVGLRSGRAYGPSLGFSVRGVIYYTTNHLNLWGSIMPAYHLNTFISKIPLIGRALTGGKNEGLFGVAYRVGGPLSKPQISVNPLSILTPGFLRQIFMGEKGEDLFEEEEPPRAAAP